MLKLHLLIVLFLTNLVSNISTKVPKKHLFIKKCVVLKKHFCITLSLLPFHFYRYIYIYIHNTYIYNTLTLTQIQKGLCRQICVFQSFCPSRLRITQDSMWDLKFYSQETTLQINFIKKSVTCFLYFNRSDSSKKHQHSERSISLINNYI